MTEAYLNGTQLDCETIDETFVKSLAVHQYSFRDRARLQDMGQDALRVRLRCYFYGERYAAHRQLLDLLKNGRAFELQHPEYGLLNGSVKNIAVHRSDLRQTAEIDIEFVEGDTEVAPVSVKDVSAVTEDDYSSGLSAAADSFSSSASAALTGQAGDIVMRELDPEQSILSQFSGLSTLAREYVKRVDATEQAFEAALAEVAIPANALISTIEFARNLPGRVIGAAARCAYRYSLLYDSIKTAPVRFVQSLRDGFAELKEAVFTGDAGTAGAVSADAHTQAAFAVATALEAGVQLGAIFSDDQERRRAGQQREQQDSFDAAGRYIAYAADEEQVVMNVREVESALYAARRMLADAVNADRGNRALQRMAAVLVEHAVDIKLERERIVRVRLDNPMPLHLVCLRHGLSYRAAERILAINAIERPNFTGGSIDIYVQ